MVDSDLAIVILRGLAESKTVTGVDDPAEIAQANGVTDRNQVLRVCDDLRDRGLIEPGTYDDATEGPMCAKITAAGRRAI